MSFLPPAKEPPSALGRYRNLSKIASVFVSPLCLGGGGIGTAWKSIGAGGLDKEKSFELLDAFYNAGGNFIDTANAYQAGESEEFIGEWMEARKNRNQIVLATKYTLDHKSGDSTIPAHHHVNYFGNNAKSMRTAVHDSLAKLRTDYIDILYVHVWGYDSSIPEVMGHLHDLVAAGKVLYLGASDMPAWVVAQANQWAVDHGKTPFAVYQGAWNILDRSFESDIIPVAREWGMAICPWNVVAGGKLRSDAEEERRRKTGENGRDLYRVGWERNATEKAVCDALQKVADEVGGTVSTVAIAYVMQKTTYVVPIVGMRKIEQIKENVNALNIALTPQHIAYLESVSKLTLGFPQSFIGTGVEQVSFWKSIAVIDRPSVPEAIRPVRK